MTENPDASFWSRIYPLIEQAASAAEKSARKFILDKYSLWQVYVSERERLMNDAASVRKTETTRSGEPMTVSEFEAHLLRLGGESEETVWVWDISDDSDENGAGTDTGTDARAGKF